MWVKLWVWEERNDDDECCSDYLCQFEVPGWSHHDEYFRCKARSCVVTRDIDGKGIWTVVKGVDVGLSAFWFAMGAEPAQTLCR